MTTAIRVASPNPDLTCFPAIIGGVTAHVGMMIVIYFWKQFSQRIGIFISAMWGPVFMITRRSHRRCWSVILPMCLTGAFRPLTALISGSSYLHDIPYRRLVHAIFRGRVKHYSVLILKPVHQYKNCLKQQTGLPDHCLKLMKAGALSVCIN